MKTIKTSKLIEQENIAHSITISPVVGRGFVIEYFLKSLTKSGKQRRLPKKVYVDKIIEDVEIPQISNRSVSHLHYNIYQYYKNATTNFYINFYKL